MTEKEIVDKVSEIMDMRFSHYDNHKMRKDYFQEIEELESIPKIVQYTGRYGPWGFAILEDMTVITSMSNWSKMFFGIADFIEEKGIQTKESTSLARKKVENIKKAEKFLKDNNCSEIINNPNKKINWV